MPKGYYTGYSYCGIMPDKRKAYFSTEKEYLEMYKFEETVKKAFSKDPKEAFKASIELAKLGEVPEDKILKSIEDVDKLFMGK